MLAIQGPGRIGPFSQHSASGSRLKSYSLTRSSDWGVQLFGPDGEEVGHFEKGRVVEFDVTADGKLLATYGHNADGRVWDVATRKPLMALDVNTRYARRGALS